MDKKIKKKWLKALRSGNYDQGTAALCRKTDEGAQYCCLGVLLEEVRGEGTWTKEDKMDTMGPKGSGYKGDGFPSNAFASSVGLDTGVMEELAGMNDSGSDFEEIANHIEEEL